MLWVTLTYVVENMFINVVHNMYPTTHALVVHIISSTLYCGYVVGVYCGLHFYVVEHMSTNVVHNMYHVADDMFVNVVHNIYTGDPQHVPHNIGYYMCCGKHTHILWMYDVENIVMLWRTFTMCCGAHVVDDTYMLWMYVVDII